MPLEIVRPLTPGDLQEPKSKGVTTPAVQKIRLSHHLIARLVAEGKKGVEIAAITGYSQSRVSLLQKDPAFAELVGYYAQQVQGKFVDVHERLAALQADAVQELQDRLDAGEKLTTFELMEIVKLGNKQGVGGQPSGGTPAVQITFVGAEGAPTIEGEWDKGNG